ncbi:hypothetical protein [Agromyces terreus]|uniref:hypothetical protein n=1 Tax=Agromyces terreus TaxID=424795 RepID=UPI0012ED35D4|nr:hypothetical protein [Agromyces terreus]
MSARGPYARYAPLRGTQSALVGYLRRGDWQGVVEALAGVLGRPVGNVWLAVAALDARGLITARRLDDGTVRLRLTKSGRSIRL